MARVGLEATFLCVLVLAMVYCVMPALAASTQIQIVKYANDNVTILHQTTVNYTWMEANLPIYGDGITRYYHQGPTFNASDPWDPAESENIDTRDFGQVKGTDLKDLCELVGGMSPGDKIKVKGTDPFYQNFSYDSVYGTDPRKGPMVVTWYRSGQGYVPTYSDGMRLIFFADNRTDTYGWNTSGWHVFGNWDMHETLPEPDWYNFSSIWPSSGGLSVKYVAYLSIYSNDPVPLQANFTATPLSGNSPLFVEFTDTSTGSPASFAWDFTNDGIVDSTAQNATHSYTAEGTYTVNLTVTNTRGTDSEVKANYITVSEAAPTPFLTNLEPGWNFISTPKYLISGADTAGVVFSGVDTGGRSIYLYNGISGLWGALDASSQLKPLDGIWIYSKDPELVSLTFTGGMLVPPTKTLAAGWNAIGFSDTTPASARATLASVRDTWTLVMGFDAGNQTYETSFINGETEQPHAETGLMYPAKGYWLYLDDPGTLAAIGA